MHALIALLLFLCAAVQPAAADTKSVLDIVQTIERKPPANHAELSSLLGVKLVADTGTTYNSTDPDDKVTFWKSAVGPIPAITRVWMSEGVGKRRQGHNSVKLTIATKPAALRTEQIEARFGVPDGKRVQAILDVPESRWPTICGYRRSWGALRFSLHDNRLTEVEFLKVPRGTFTSL